MSRVVLEGLKRSARRKFLSSRREVANATLLRAASILRSRGELSAAEEREFLGWLVEQGGIEAIWPAKRSKKKRKKHPAKKRAQRRLQIAEVSWGQIYDYFSKFAPKKRARKGVTELNRDVEIDYERAGRDLDYNDWVRKNFGIRIDTEETMKLRSARTTLKRRLLKLQRQQGVANENRPRKKTGKKRGKKR